MLDAKDVSVLMLHETRSTLLGNFLSQLTTLARASAELQSCPITRLFDSCTIEFVCDSTILILFVFSTKHDRMSSSTVFERIIESQIHRLYICAINQVRT